MNVGISPPIGGVQQRALHLLTESLPVSMIGNEWCTAQSKKEKFTESDIKDMDQEMKCMIRAFLLKIAYLFVHFLLNK